MTHTPDPDDNLISGLDLLPGDIIHIPRGYFEVAEIRKTAHGVSLQLRHVDTGLRIHVPTAGATPFLLVQSHAER